MQEERFGDVARDAIIALTVFRVSNIALFNRTRGIVMRLVNFGPVGIEQPGVLVDDDTVVPLVPILARAGLRLHDMKDILALWSTIRTIVEPQLTLERDRIALSDVRIGPPILRPNKVVAIGFNYPQHSTEILGPSAEVSEPVIFLKPPNCVSGPNDSVVKPFETTMLDYEIELGVVIGKTGRRISQIDALDHVAGYVVANDITARDIALGAGLDHPLQLQIARGKGYATFCPLGPWLATADEVPEPADLRLTLSINGVVRQNGKTSSMLASIPELIASVSASMELEPGDVILTGTPAGCGFQLDPPAYLQHGDRVEAGITGLGEMTFQVQNEQV
ncbi:fumarylacetoacetate hydrolase family protein [Rhodococcus erythropolis]|nr:fumarylacetoacetate hydrolase family protein [Rhodococcus erythropolis]